MTSLATTLHGLIGDLREDLQQVVAAQGRPTSADVAKVRIADIVDLAGHSSAVTEAAGHIAEAVDRVLDVQAQARQAGTPARRSARSNPLAPSTCSKTRSPSCRRPCTGCRRGSMVYLGLDIGPRPYPRFDRTARGRITEVIQA